MEFEEYWKAFLVGIYSGISAGGIILFAQVTEGMPILSRIFLVAVFGIPLIFVLGAIGWFVVRPKGKNKKEKS